MPSAALTSSWITEQQGRRTGQAGSRKGTEAQRNRGHAEGVRKEQAAPAMKAMPGLLCETSAASAPLREIRRPGSGRPGSRRFSQRRRDAEVSAEGGEERDGPACYKPLPGLLCETFAASAPLREIRLSGSGRQEAAGSRRGAETRRSRREERVRDRTDQAHSVLARPTLRNLCGSAPLREIRPAGFGPDAAGSRRGTEAAEVSAERGQGVHRYRRAPVASKRWP